MHVPVSVMLKVLMMRLYRITGSRGFGQQQQQQQNVHFMEHDSGL